MKKWVTLLILLMIQNAVWAQDLQTFNELQAPTWKEFCPLQYCAAEFGPITRPPGFLFEVGAIMAWPVLLVPYTIKANKHSASLTRNYWANRRLQFNGELNLCHNSTSDKAICYLQVRQMEDQKNADHQAHIDRVAINASARQANTNLNQIRYQMTQQRH